MKVQVSGYFLNYRKSSIKPPAGEGGGGAYFMPGPKRRGLTERGCLLKIKCYIHNNFPNFTIIPITETEEEIGFVSPFFKYNVIYVLTQPYS